MERKYGIFEIIEILYCCEISWLPYSLEIKLSLLRAKKLNPEWLYKPSVWKNNKHFVTVLRFTTVVILSVK